MYENLEILRRNLYDEIIKIMAYVFSPKRNERSVVQPSPSVEQPVRAACKPQTHLGPALHAPPRGGADDSTHGHRHGQTHA